MSTLINISMDEYINICYARKRNILNTNILRTIKKARGNRINTRGSVEFTAKDKINADLYYSLQHVNFSIKGIKKEAYGI